MRGQDSEQGAARLRPASALSLLGSDLVRAPVDEDVLLESRQHALAPSCPFDLVGLSRKIQNRGRKLEALHHRATPNMDLAGMARREDHAGEDAKGLPDSAETGMFHPSTASAGGVPDWPHSYQTPDNSERESEQRGHQPTYLQPDPATVAPDRGWPVRHGAAGSGGGGGGFPSTDSRGRIRTSLPGQVERDPWTKAHRAAVPSPYFQGGPEGLLRSSGAGKPPKSQSAEGRGPVDPAKEACSRVSKALELFRLLASSPCGSEIGDGESRFLLTANAEGVEGVEGGEGEMGVKAESEDGDESVWAQEGFLGEVQAGGHPLSECQRVVGIEGFLQILAQACLLRGRGGVSDAGGGMTVSEAEATAVFKQAIATSYGNAASALLPQVCVCVYVCACVCVCVCVFSMCTPNTQTTLPAHCFRWSPLNVAANSVQTVCRRELPRTAFRRHG